MKLLLTILACLVAASAGAQTVKSLGYNTTNGQVVYSGSNSLTFTNALQFSTNARAATRTNLGGTTVGDALFTAASTNAARIALGATIVGANIFTVPIQYQELYLRINADNTVSSLSPAAVRTNLGLGATNAVTFSNITVSGTLAVTGDTALSGVNNTMPNATNAASGSSLMTRDLVETEMGTVRAEINHTYWFGLEGQGGWLLGGNSPLVVFSGQGSSGSFRRALVLYSTAGIGSSSTGAYLNLAASQSDLSQNAVTMSSNNPLVLEARLLRHTYSSEWPNASSGVSFQVASTNSPSFWGNTNTIGLFYVPQPTNAWASNAVVTANTRIAVGNVVFAVATAGTNAATEPAWPDAINSVVTNGNAVYRNVGPHTANVWALAIGSTNASEVVMTNTTKTLHTQPNYNTLNLSYNNLTATMVATVTDSSGSSQVSLPFSARSGYPQFHARRDILPAGGASLDSAIVLHYFSIRSQF